MPYSSIATSCLCRWSNEAPAGRSQFWNAADQHGVRVGVVQAPHRAHGQGDVLLVLVGRQRTPTDGVLVVVGTRRR